MLVLEPSGLDSGTINVQVLVIQELLVNVGGEGGEIDLGFLEHVRPGLEMLLVNVCANSLHVHLLDSLGLHPSEERVLNTEERSNVLGDGLLCGVTRVSQVVDFTGFSVILQVPESAGNIVDVDGVQLQLSVPQKLHLLVVVLVDGTDDQTGHDVVEARRTVDEARTDDDVVESVVGVEIGMIKEC